MPAEPISAGGAGDNPYDRVPYETTPFAYTQPSRLAAVGKLFGMAPADVRTARVLELGCARGDNLLPLAARFPEARFVGIDYSPVQIAAAESMRRAIGLPNVGFREMSIADIGPALGKFDYIICHGVLSWVPEPVRAAIFRVCGANLAPGGIAMVSYNTFPGWHQARAAREMMLYHTAGFADPREKVAQARVLVKFLADSAPENQQAYRDFLAAELGILESNPDSYVLHDHLEETNQPFYFHEVAARARAVGLEYLGESHVEASYAGNFKPAVAAALATTDDTVRIEQYLDFVANRRFRISLFCRLGTQLHRQVDANRIFEFDLESIFEPVDPATVDLSADVPLKFRAPNGTTVDTTNRYAAALMVVLSRLHGRTIRADEAVRRALGLLGPGAAPQTESAVRAAIAELGMQLVLGGAVRLHTVPVDAPLEPGERPRAFGPALAAARAGRSPLWSQLHGNVRLDAGALALLAACDGTRDRDALVAHLFAEIAAGRLMLHIAGAQVDPASANPAVRAEFARWIETCLGEFARQALLV